MSGVWVAVIVVGAATIALKALGPVVVGGRRMPNSRPGSLAASGFSADE